MPTFTITFDRAASFPRGGHNKAFVLRSGETTVALLDFQNELVVALAGTGLKVPVQKNFGPHLTLLYDAKNVSEAEVAPINWRVQEFALVLSHRRESRYEILGTWRLPEPAV